MPDAILPELARSLKAFGLPRNAVGDAAEAAIFTPLLEARAQAASGDTAHALASLRGDALWTRIASGVAKLAAEGQADAAHRRARTAHALELLDPLEHALSALDVAAVAAQGCPLSSVEWNGWIAQLRQVFVAADDACRSLSRVLAESTASAPARRWFSRP